MESREKSDLESLALSAELARQLCHDFNNFLYNLLMQIEIAKVSPTSASDNVWDAVNRAGAEIVRRLREWDKFQRRYVFDETTVDLHRVIRDVVDRVVTPDRRITLAPSIHAEKLEIGTATLDCRHFLHLLLDDTINTWMETTETIPVVSVSTGKSGSSAHVRIVAENANEPLPSRADSSDDRIETLMAAACRSMAVRLGATISRDRDERGREVILVAFPLSMLNA
jgi:hypothetical protein